MTIIQQGCIFEMNDALGYYKILQLNPSADDESIKNSYRALAKIWHPDSNPSAEAVEMFQRISTAHDTLSNPERRQIYDILSLAFDEKNFPDVKNLALACDGSEDVNLRVVDIFQNNAWFINCSTERITKALSWSSAQRLIRQAAYENWLRGWWHYRSFFFNFYAIWHNLFSPVSSSQTLKMLLCNMIVHHRAGRTVQAEQCGALALAYLSAADGELIKKYLASPLSSVSVKPWPLYRLRQIQCAWPLGAVIVFLSMAFALWGRGMLRSPQAIDYYHSVNFNGRGQITDDMVVGNILNIPVDRSDNSRLYHLTERQNIMYGPSDKFDIIKELQAAATVRLTGITPDNIWSRVLLDNGEMGFVKTRYLRQGMGATPPFGSKIVE